MKKLLYKLALFIVCAVMLLVSFAFAACGSGEVTSIVDLGFEDAGDDVPGGSDEPPAVDDDKQKEIDALEATYVGRSDGTTHFEAESAKLTGSARVEVNDWAGNDYGIANFRNGATVTFDVNSTYDFEDVELIIRMSSAAVTTLTGGKGSEDITLGSDFLTVNGTPVNIESALDGLSEDDDDFTERQSLWGYYYSYRDIKVNIDIAEDENVIVLKNSLDKEINLDCVMLPSDADNDGYEDFSWEETLNVAHFEAENGTFEDLTIGTANYPDNAECIEFQAEVDVLTMNVNSDKACDAYMLVNMSSAEEYSANYLFTYWTGVTYGGTLTADIDLAEVPGLLKVNGETVEMSHTDGTTKVSKISGFNTDAYKYYTGTERYYWKYYKCWNYYFNTIYVPITLKEGANEIVLSGSDEHTYNIDYIEITSSALPVLTLGAATEPEDPEVTEYYEAEDATLNGSSVITETSAHGGECVSVSAVNNTVSWSITSDKDVTAKLELCVSSPLGSDGNPMFAKFDYLWELSVNGAVKTTNAELESSTVAGEKYWNTITLSKVELSEGVNTVTLKLVNEDGRYTVDDGAYGCPDYIAVTGKAVFA